MSYAQQFEPKKSRLIEGNEPSPVGLDIRDGSIYVWTEEIVLAVNIAIHTGRPLLICGRPGTGKSSLAAFVARTMEWNYFEEVINSKYEARDLLWHYDAMRRLRDAYKGQPINDQIYVEPRVLWWAINPQQAEDQVEKIKSTLAVGAAGPLPPGKLRGNDRPSVVLLDEIDKADPDLPNDLLVALGSHEFRITDTGQLIQRSARPLIMITSNDERSLPPAFVRRCVILTLKFPSSTELAGIAKAHFPDPAGEHEALFKRVAERVKELHNDADAEGCEPSIAEYLDAVRACVKYSVMPPDEPGTASPIWIAIESAVLLKRKNEY